MIGGYGSGSDPPATAAVSIAIVLGSLVLLLALISLWRRAEPRAVQPNLEEPDGRRPPVGAQNRACDIPLPQPQGLRGPTHYLSRRRTCRSSG
jgi:hypothetical protein